MCTLVSNSNTQWTGTHRATQSGPGDYLVLLGSEALGCLIWTSDGITQTDREFTGEGATLHLYSFSVYVYL